MEFPNKANPAVAKALEESDTDEIMRLVNFTLIHDMGRWKHHYPLHLIRVYSARRPPIQPLRRSRPAKSRQVS
jgi:hypothetical protein